LNKSEKDPEADETLKAAYKRKKPQRWLVVPKILCAGQLRKTGPAALTEAEDALRIPEKKMRYGFRREGETLKGSPQRNLPRWAAGENRGKIVFSKQ
jgi:hypothetical protein